MLLEYLERRDLMAAALVARDDAAYFTPLNTDLVVSLVSSPAHLLANDLDIDGGTQAASVVTSPSSGTLVSFNANGSFTYRPNTGFTGVDTFTYKVNDGNRLSSLTHSQGATTLASYSYGYDGMSRPTSINSSIEGLSTFSYDATSQLTVADHTSQTDETYGYNLNGSRNTTGYTTSTNNQISAAPGFTYTYDFEGNRTKRTETATGKVQEYTWDQRNRLTTVKDRNTSAGAVVRQVDYVYDYKNRLVKRTYDADGAGAVAATSQYWVYDEGINAVLQYEGSAASTLSHRYLWSDQVDQLLSDEQVTSLGVGGNTLWALSDHLGTVRDIADFNEGTGITAIANHRTYNAFGKLTAETNAAVDLLYGFTGKQLDEATNLQHNLNRWYDAALGQWLSEDPIGFQAGDANLRRYVDNFSSTRTDSLGLQDDYDRERTEEQAEKDRAYDRAIKFRPLIPYSPDENSGYDALKEFLKDNLLDYAKGRSKELAQQSGFYTKTFQFLEARRAKKEADEMAAKAKAIDIAYSLSIKSLSLQDILYILKDEYVPVEDEEPGIGIKIDIKR